MGDVKTYDTDKIVLDACCGGRMFWFDKENPLVLFQDVRNETHELCDGRVHTIGPDVVADFTDMPYPDKSFKHVVFDPPHLVNIGETSWMRKKYGSLPKDWRPMIKAGFDECMRVLDDYGVLVFKWNEDQVTVGEVIKAIRVSPM